MFKLWRICFPPPVGALAPIRLSPDYTVTRYRQYRNLSLEVSKHTKVVWLMLPPFYSLHQKRLFNARNCFNKHLSFLLKRPRHCPYYPLLSRLFVRPFIHIFFFNGIEFLFSIQICLKVVHDLVGVGAIGDINSASDSGQESSHLSSASALHRGGNLVPPLLLSTAKLGPTVHVENRYANQPASQPASQPRRHSKPVRC